MESLESRSLLTGGAFDPSFGEGGLALADFPYPIAVNTETSQVQQSDGKVVVLAGGVVSRFTATGAPDPTFGVGGHVQVRAGTTSAPFQVGNTLATQPDGAILVSGTYATPDRRDRAAVIRLDASGHLDTNFGVDGVAYFSAYVSQVAGLAVQSDGKVVIGGTVDISTYAPDGPYYVFYVGRIDAAGRIDLGFGEGGATYTDAAPGFSGEISASAFAIQPDDKIVLGGHSSSSIVLARYGADGGADRSFSGDGLAYATPTTVLSLGAPELAIQPSGKIDVGFEVYKGFQIAQFTASGALDLSYGVKGYVVESGPAGSPLPISLVADGGGLLVGHSTHTAQSAISDFQVSRYTATGQLDAGYGVGGRVTTDLGSDDRLFTLGLQTSGRLIATGLVGAATTTTLALVGYQPTGALDPNFGVAGKRLTQVLASGNDAASDVVVLGDGSYVVGGATSNASQALARYDASGQLVPGFGVGGIALDAQMNGPLGPKLALNADGTRIIAATGQVTYDSKGVHYTVKLARYTTSGALDTAFGTGGYATIAPNRSSFLTDVVVQADGKILVLYGTQSLFPNILSVTRLAANGQVDTSYGTGGTATINFGGNGDSLAGLLLQPDGKLVVAGTLFKFAAPNAGGSFALTRLDTTGHVDPTFGTAGQTVTPFLTPAGTDPSRSSARATTLIALPDGKLLVGGYATVTGNGVLPYTGDDFALARYSADGQLDTSFGVDGRVTKDLAAGLPGEAFNLDSLATLVIQPDGKILAGGNAFRNNSRVAALARFLPDGQVDADFGTNGVYLPDLGPTSGASVLLQAAGDRVLLVGSATLGVSADFVIARLDESGPTPPPIPTAPTIAFAGGVLTISGLETSDTLTVASRADGRITLNGVATGYLLNQVTALEVYGNGGNDTISLANFGGGTFAGSIFVDAGAGNDTIIGSRQADRLDGGEGDDNITGGLGSDTINGGSGDDKLTGNGGDDVISGGDDDDQITGGDGADSLTGGSGDDTITGGLGADTIDGGSGDDTLAGNDGDDVISGGGDDDRIAGGKGKDTVDGGEGDDTINGGIGDDTINGGGGDDLLLGYTGNDSLAGGEGDNTLRGGGGNDTLVCGAGSNLLQGNAGADRLVLQGTDEDDLIALAISSVSHFQATKTPATLPAGVDTLLVDVTDTVQIFSLAGNDTITVDLGIVLPGFIDAGPGINSATAPPKWTIINA